MTPRYLGKRGRQETYSLSAAHIFSAYFTEKGKERKRRGGNLGIANQTTEEKRKRNGHCRFHPTPTCLRLFSTNDAGRTKEEKGKERGGSSLRRRQRKVHKRRGGKKNSAQHNNVLVLNYISLIICA